MQRSISYKEILKTGKFGDVELGMTREELIALLGEPECEGKQTEEISGLFYGQYEFYYWSRNNRLYGFRNSHLITWGEKKAHREQICFSNDLFNIDPSFINPGEIVLKSDVKSWLKANDIAFEEKPGDSDDVYFHFPSGVTLRFIDTNSFWYLDDNNKVKQEESIGHPDNFLLEGIRHHNFGISEG